MFVPSSPANLSSLPVMVWLHGGAFVFGMGYGYGPVYWAVHDILLVTINYRLGDDRVMVG